MIRYFMSYVSAKVKEEEGQGMVEYALLVGLIAVVVIVVVTALGVDIQAKFQSVVDAL